MAALSDRQLELLKNGKNFGVVGTVGEDGRPQTSVVWVDTDGERVVFNTKPSRAKGRNLLNDGRLSVTVWDNEDPYKYFEVEGTAELDEEGAGEHINELSLRYEGKPFHTTTDRVIVRVNASRVLDHGIDD
jgi:PPOX class probable F420-dependent enzyme